MRPPCTAARLRLFTIDGFAADSICCACSSSPTGMPFLKKTPAATRIIALLMAHPTSIENIVSYSSYFIRRWMNDSPSLFQLRL